MDYLLLLSSIVLGAACVFLFRLYEPRHVKLPTRLSATGSKSLNP